jgi:hypothetical protein
LKKTTAKGAYKKNAKKNFQKRRAPMVETKKRTQEMIATGSATPDNIPNGITTNTALNFDQAYQFVPVWSFLSMTRGLGDDQMVGSSVYARYLKSRIVVTIGHNAATPGIGGIAEELRVIHGWVTAPMNLNTYTTPNADVLDRSALQVHINTRVKEYFDDRGDPLRFRPKVGTQIKILGNRKIVRKASQYNMAPQAVYDSDQGEIVYEGTADEVTVNSTWPMNRKIHYTESNHQTGETDKWYYPNTSWLPFVVFFSPRFGATIAGGLFRYNNVFYFSDS